MLTDCNSLIDKCRKLVIFKVRSMHVAMALYNI